MNEVQVQAKVPFIELVRVGKTFGATHAVTDVSTALATRGEIHALVGENGAGKSTCLGIASGRLSPTTGSVLINGSAIATGSPRSALRAGVHTIYQELTIVPALSPAANVFLGNDIARAGWLMESEMRSGYEELCSRLNLEPSSAKRSGDLSVADQQMLEIVRALVSDASALLFDEPTASLAHAERNALFATMTRLRAEGLAMTLVTHNLEDVLEHSDVVTVFRDGRVVERRPTSAWTKRDMVSAMLGAKAGLSPAVGGLTQRPARTDSGPRKPALSVRSLSSPGVLHDISFEVRPGEILGIAGLVGSGRTSILRALAGLDRRASGEVHTSGSSEARPPRTVREARRRGIALLPEDRKGQGLVLPLSGSENVTLGEWKGLSLWGFLRASKVMNAAGRAAAPVGFDPARIDEPAQSLSGGNQQKLMLARWMHTDHRILLADEPTRGVDVGAKAEILIALERIVALQRSIILVSSELEEVVGLSDRVLVLHDGRLLEVLDSAIQDITVAGILHAIFAATDDLESTRSTP
jgi:rhamnose transport system ATP-binding protein